MWGKVITFIALVTAMFSACCLDSPELTGRFLIVFLVSMAWIVGYAFINGYMYTGE